MSISYELCKQLKNAGFPQFNGDFKGEIIEDPSAPEGEEPISCYSPTLHELIEACGDWFYNLRKDDVGKRWTADSVSPGYKWKDSQTRQPEVIYCMGFTPEEAVANLYLALKSKK